MACGEAFDFGFAGEAGRDGAVAARGFHDEHVGFHVFKTRAFQDGLVVETNVAGVEERLFLAAHHDAGRAERVAGVVKFQRGRGKTGAGFVEGGPFDFAVVFEALKERRDVVHFVVGEERIFLDAQFVALAGHDVDGVVQHALDDEVAQLGHQHVGFGKMAQRHRQRADVIVVAMRNGDGVQVLVLDEVVEAANCRGLRVWGACRRPSAGDGLRFRRTRRWRRCRCPGSG